MRRELEELLYQRYPALFEKKELAPGEFPMQRGFECGDGWFDLLDKLCSNLQYLSDHNADWPQVNVVQVKEKIGTLRFNFLDSGNEYARGMAHMAMALSELICQECGATRCKKHDPSRFAS